MATHMYAVRTYFLNYYANKKYDWNYQTKILICLKQSSSLFDFL